MNPALRESQRRYDLAADGYALSWAPVLLALSRPLFDEVPVSAGTGTLDLGCGPGVLAAQFAVDGASVVGLDGSIEMARRIPPPVAPVVGDGARSPFAPGAFDVVMCTFALQHMPRPGRAIAGAFQALRPGGLLGTVTWGRDHGEEGGPYAILDAVLESAGVGPDPLGMPKTWHHLVHDPQQLRRYARRAGFSRIRVWAARGAWDWTPDGFFRYARDYGTLARRFATLPADARAEALGALERGLAGLTADDLRWAPELVFLVAER